MNRPDPYDRTTHDGKTVDWYTKLALQRAEQITGYDLSIVQGSYNRGGVSASGGTHDGGGVIDLSEWDWQTKVRALRRVGFAAWRRPKSATWNGHIHAVQVTNKRLSAAAADQASDAAAGRNGLADNGPDPHAGIMIRPWRWPYAGPVGLIVWQRDQLTGDLRQRYERSVARRLNLNRRDLP